MAALDAVWTLGLYLAARGIVTIARWNRGRAPFFCTLAFVGAASAIGVERWALITNRWTYTTAMPIVPLLGVGLWPTLQMTIIPGLITWLLVPSAPPRGSSGSERRPCDIASGRLRRSSRADRDTLLAPDATREVVVAGWVLAAKAEREALRLRREWPKRDLEPTRARHHSPDGFEEARLLRLLSHTKAQPARTIGPYD